MLRARACLRALCLPALTGSLLPVWAQKPSVIPLVPAANWRLVKAEPLGLEAVRRWGGDPAIEREYGVKTLEARTYRLGQVSVEALVEEAADPSSAYGLLTFYRTDALTTPRGMEITLSGAGGALMGRGRFFIRVPRSADSGLSENDFVALLIFIGGTRPSRRELAALPAPLPPQGLVQGTEKYVLGLEAARRVLPKFRSDLIGFPQGAEAQVAAYRSGSKRATVLALNYPTPQIARARFGAMESILSLNQERGAESIYGRREGSFVILVLDSESRGAATPLIDKFQISDQISWDQPPPRKKTFWQDLGELVIANFLLIAILGGFSLAGGLMVFSFIRAMRKWAPKSTWLPTEEGSIIRLNLS